MRAAMPPRAANNVRAGTIPNASSGAKRCIRGRRTRSTGAESGFPGPQENTGARDEVVCGLKWDWEIPIPELGVSVFNVPRESVKGRKRDRVLVCNSVAQSIIDSVRGQHPEFVFVYSQRVKKPKYARIETMNNTAWQQARKKAGLSDLHIHDLRHTVGMRLREADVREETIAAILWHTRPGMTAHYSVAQVAELVEALNRITDERHRTNRSLAMIAREALEAKKSPNLPMQIKSG